MQLQRRSSPALVWCIVPTRERLSMKWVWLFFDDVHLMISRCGAGLERCVWLGWETVPRREA